MICFKNFDLRMIGMLLLSLIQGCGFSSPEGINCLSSPEAAISYEATFLPFVTKSTCNSCHTTTGIMSRTPFADADAFISYGAFYRLGPLGLKNKLLNGHQGFVFSTLQEDFESAEAAWLTSVDEICKSG